MARLKTIVSEYSLQLKDDYVSLRSGKLSYNHTVNDMFTMMICPIHSLISQCSSPWSLGAGSLYQDDRGECDADWVGRHLGTESLSILHSLTLATKILDFLLQEWILVSIDTNLDYNLEGIIDIF